VPSSQLPYTDWALAQRSRVEQALGRALPQATLQPERLHAAMRYSTLNGGKRIRALLAYSASETCAAEWDALDAVACAVEMIHAYSLIHDDLPCMDNDVLRRGQATCHVQFDEATAMLAGDALQPLAFALLARAPVSDAQRVRLLDELAQASGSLGMAGGQAIDLAGVGKALSVNELEVMHRLKTGALIRAAVRMGVHCGGVVSGQMDAVSNYADALGLAFQVTDDILDAEGTAEQLGKSAGKDAADDKPTYVTILGLDAAKQHAARLTQHAHDALAPCGTHAKRLHEIADEVLRRKH
jgi:farnesyl diphosphate synthase